MTEITAKPFDWNDNLSKEALEDFEGIQKDLPYCTCQSIGMALAKLELLEKQGCKVIDPSVSSSEKPNKCEDAISRQAVLELVNGWVEIGEDKFPNGIDYLKMRICKLPSIPPAKLQEPKSEWQQDHEILKAYSDGANDVLDKIRDEIREQSRMHMDGDLYIKTSSCMRIINDYMAEEDKE